MKFRITSGMILMALLVGCTTTKYATTKKADTIYVLHPLVIPFKKVIDIKGDIAQFKLPGIADSSFKVNGFAIDIDSGNITIKAPDKQIVIDTQIKYVDTGTTITNTIRITVTKTKHAIPWFWLGGCGALVVIVAILTLAVKYLK